MIQGSCLCGAVQYDLTIEPDHVPLKTSICHCRPCRKISGGVASLNLTVSRDNFVLRNGDDALATYQTTHVDAGFDFTVSFCRRCGSPIYAVPLMQPARQDTGSEPLVIQVGTVDNPSVLEVPPAVELNVKDRLHWVGEIKAAVQKRAYKD